MVCIKFLRRSRCWFCCHRDRCDRSLDLSANLLTGTITTVLGPSLVYVVQVHDFPTSCRDCSNECSRHPSHPDAASLVLTHNWHRQSISLLVIHYDLKCQWLSTRRMQAIGFLQQQLVWYNSSVRNVITPVRFAVLSRKLSPGPESLAGFLRRPPCQ